MTDLSPRYKQIKQLRSNGDCAAAISMLRGKPPASDEDAFEAVVCLFVCGDVDSAVNVCNTHPWKKEWAAQIVGALSESVRGGNASRALTLARKAAGASAAPYDAAAIYLLLLQKNDLIEEAGAYIENRLANAPVSETFLQTMMAEIAVSAGHWRKAYAAACGVLAADPDDYRALVVLSIANYETGNIHESLGQAVRASLLRKGSLPAILQLMRCRNKLGNYYAALAAYDTLSDKAAAGADVHVELGRAYHGLEDFERAIAEYRAALAAGLPAAAAVRPLLRIYVSAGRTADLEALIAAYPEVIDGDMACLVWLGLAALDCGDLDQASQRFRKTLALADASGEPSRELRWPVRSRASATISSNSTCWRAAAGSIRQHAMHSHY